MTLCPLRLPPEGGDTQQLQGTLIPQCRESSSAWEVPRNAVPTVPVGCDYGPTVAAEWSRCCAAERKDMGSILTTVAAFWVEAETPVC